ncbi:hypothetical protein ACFL51_00795 [Myxococcota bacterium]
MTWLSTRGTSGEPNPTRRATPVVIQSVEHERETGGGSSNSQEGAASIASPRPAHPEDRADFELEICEEPQDAGA